MPSAGTPIWQLGVGFKNMEAIKNVVDGNGALVRGWQNCPTRSVGVGQSSSKE
jgi:hypothetical protein